MNSLARSSTLGHLLQLACQHSLRACFSRLIRVAVLLLVGLSPSTVIAVVAPTSTELQMTATWVRENFLTSRVPPFSFRWGGTPSAAVLGNWPRQVTTRQLSLEKTEHVIVWTGVQAGLEVRCVLVEYHTHPVAEWTVYIKNIGAQNSTVLRDILGLDMTLTRTNRFEYSLFGIQGDINSAESYRPFELVLGPGASKVFSPPAVSGKSSDGPDGWPYHNLRMPGGGIMIAVGWPGQWATSFTRVGTRRLEVKSGQQLTNLYLKPGEEIRTPLMAMLFWRGTDTVRSQNLWRHWYLDHVLPSGAGPVQQIQVSGNDRARVNFFISKGIVPDIAWRDAGGTATWYPSSMGPYTGDLVWLNTGTWEVDPARHPFGFRPFSDHCHSLGVDFLLWFEPERIGSPATFLGSRPEWLLPGTASTVGAILNLGHPDAYNWLVNHYDGLIKSQGIDWYREDMNGEGPLPAWRNYDASNRQGITENFYVQAHLRLWDELKSRNPLLRIDSCASGGRRNDLETMRRAVPLLRSDFQFADQAGVVEGNQCHIYGLSYWLPFHGTGCYLYDPYSFRSFNGACFGMGGLDAANEAAQRQAYSENKQIAPIMVFGDYYPLTPFSLANNVWIGWQFDQPSKGEGFVQVFRRASAASNTITLKLQGLVAAGTYQVKNFDQPTNVQNLTGQSLMTNGLVVQLPTRGSAIFSYKLAASSH
jgi:alpha-galactosidase